MDNIIITDSKGIEKTVDMIQFTADCINKFCEEKKFFIGQNDNTGIIFWVSGYKDYGFFINNKEHDFHIYYCMESSEDNYLDKIGNHVFISNKNQKIPFDLYKGIQLESKISKESLKHIKKLYTKRKDVLDIANIITPQDSFNQYPLPIKIRRTSNPLFRSFLNDITMDNYKDLYKLQEIDQNFDFTFFHKIKDLKIKNTLNITPEEKEIIELTTDIIVPKELLNGYNLSIMNKIRNFIK